MASSDSETVDEVMVVDRPNASSLFDNFFQHSANEELKILTKNGDRVTIEELLNNMKEERREAIIPWDQGTFQLVFQRQNIYITHENNAGGLDIALYLMGCNLWDKILSNIFSSLRNNHASEIAAAICENSFPVDSVEAKNLARFFHMAQKEAPNGQNTRGHDADQCVLNIVGRTDIDYKAKLVSLTSSQLRHISKEARRLLLVTMPTSNTSRNGGVFLKNVLEFVTDGYNGTTKMNEREVSLKSLV